MSSIIILKVLVAVTYSTVILKLMGVSKKVIDTYTVYSKETAMEMALAISDFTKSDLGVGITGRLTSNVCKEKGFIFAFMIEG